MTFNLITLYNGLLFLHSILRWLVLISFVYSLCIGYSGWWGNKIWTKKDNTLRHVTATIAHVQLIFGLCLYFTSPITTYFLRNFKEALHERPIRFFGMEHSTMMFTAIILITIGSIIAKRKITDKDKFKMMAIWYSLALVIILMNIPWPFSPMSGRPWIRGL